MKILTYGNNNYIPYLVNLYRSLKRFNRHGDLIVLCPDEVTVTTIKQIEPDCNVSVYTHPQYTYGHCDNIWANIGIMQYIKISALYEYYNKHNEVFYIDADVCLMQDLPSKAEKMLKTFDYVVKFYQQRDRFQTEIITNLVNSGTLAVKKTPKTDKLFDYFFEKTKQYPTPSMNMEEYILTWYITKDTGYGIFNELQNLTNDEFNRYSIEDIKNSNTMSFHPTYSLGKDYKIDISKQLNTWFYE